MEKSLAGAAGSEKSVAYASGSEKSIFLAVPHYGAIVPEALVSLTMASCKHRVSLTTNGASLLAFNFNSLWGSALNQRRDKGLTHFAMHHADVGAEPGWIDILLEEMAKVGADVIATVIPIKDNRGLTSTGIQDPEHAADPPADHDGSLSVCR